MKLAVVSPRYGTDVPGGAETAARLVASNLAARTDWDVEVLTTCAADASTWANHFAPGVETVGGVPVHRFTVERGRDADFDEVCRRVLPMGKKATDAMQREWLERQGPVSAGLLDAIASTDADLVAFHPYLFHPTVEGVRLRQRSAVLHPAAHDEPAIRLPMFREIFEAAGGLVLWSDPERRFVECRFKVGAQPQLVLGIGVEAGDGDGAAARDAIGVGDAPFVLCLGRVDDSKGARLLLECFTRYKERRPGPLRLVFAGPVVSPLERHPDVVVAGAVEEDVKWGLLRAAIALVSPSAFESFSLVLMEAWTVATPAIVNGRSAVTADHARRSGGALVFSSYAEFEADIERLIGDEALRSHMGAAGLAYVERHYRWPEITSQYDQFLRKLLSRQG